MNTDRFKFRVWNNLINAYEDYGFLLDVRKGVVAGQNTDIYILEQCTGLRDKNGKLIFEGDILRLSFDDGDKVDREIYYAQGCAQYFLRHRDKRLFDCYTFNSSVANDLEIIGNIHEKEGE